MPTPFHMAWFLQGSSIQAWGEPWTGNISEDWMSADLFKDLARSLERACFDYLLIEDSIYIGQNWENWCGAPTSTSTFATISWPSSPDLSPSPSPLQGAGIPACAFQSGECPSQAQIFTLPGKSRRRGNGAGRSTRSARRRGKHCSGKPCDGGLPAMDLRIHKIQKLP